MTDSSVVGNGVLGGEASANLYDGRRVKATRPLAGMRRMIADHMLRSLATAAQLTDMGEIDMAEMVKLRQSLVSQEQALGTRITYTSLVILAVSRVLKNHPLVNASIMDNEIKFWEDVNISVAVALDEGLIVPVIRNADKKSLVEIDQELKSLTAKARERRLKPDEVKGGTFTVTNVGSVAGGWRLGTPIINQPESAILATGTITDRPAVVNKQVVVRPIMTFSLTYDHRLIDGATAAKFLNDVIALLEHPQNLDGLPGTGAGSGPGAVT